MPTSSVGVTDEPGLAVLLVSVQHLQNRERASFGFMCEDLQYEDVEESIQEVRPKVLSIPRWSGFWPEVV